MSAPTMSQYAALEALRVGEPYVQEMRAEYDRRRRMVVRELNAMGLKTFEPRGAFYAFPNIESTGLDDEKFCERLLMEGKVAVVPGRSFGDSGMGFVRVSYAASYENLEISMQRISNFLSTL
jgi:aminotransferase